MFNHLLAPLDGSTLAESALPATVYLAKALHASVTFMHVIEQNAPKGIHSDRHLTQPAEAEAYLREVAERVLPLEIPVRTHVHTVEVKDVARSIVDHTEELGQDLIIMCSHGHGGARDWLFGSIAQQVLSFGRTPVLLLPPKEMIGSAFSLTKAIVPLDGVAEHEQGLPVAIDLARACQAALHLLMVIPTMGKLRGEHAATASMAPSATRVLLELAEQGGRDYLTDHLNQLRESGLKLSAEVQRGDPVKVIVKTAMNTGADLIVMGTHGKTGTDAFWSGSVTPQVARRSMTPMLLVPVHPTA